MEIEKTNILINQRTGHPATMVMQRLDLSGQVYPVGAMLRLTHKFKTEEDGEPFEAIYVSMLPQNGTLRRFTVKGEDFEAKSEMKPREKARESYEEGVQGGHLSVLAETSADGLVSLNVGQVRPGEEIAVIMEIVVGVEATDKGYRFRYPFTIPPGYHPQVKSYATDDGGKQELPSSVFGDLILPEWKTDSEDLHEVSFNIVAETGGVLDSVASPSHRISVRPSGTGAAEVSLASGDGVPNRDLVIDVKTEKPVFAVFADKSLLEEGEPIRDISSGDKVVERVPGKAAMESTLPEDAPRWTAVIPSQMVPKAENTPRKVCFVIDRSGSMSGQPLDRAKRAVLTCMSALGPKDEFGIVHFGSDNKFFHKKMATATDKHRKQAKSFINGIEVEGATEMLAALGTALKVLGGPGGDIFLLTDGEIWETGPVIEQAATVGTRIHSLGIGAAAKSKFLVALSRRSKGVSKLVGATEDTATAALTLLNTIRDPRQVGVKATVARPDDVDVGTVWEGIPALVNDPGEGLPKTITLSFGKEVVPVTMDRMLPVPEGMVALLSAGRQLEDLDSIYDVSQPGTPLRTTTEQKMETLSMSYGLASRAVSLCSVIERVGDQEGVTPEQQVVPVGLPEDLQQQAYFGGGSITRSVSLSGFGGSYASPGVYMGEMLDSNAPRTAFYSQVSCSTAAPDTMESVSWGMQGGGGTTTAAHPQELEVKTSQGISQMSLGGSAGGGRSNMSLGDSFGDGDVTCDSYEIKEGPGVGVVNPRGVTSITFNDSTPTDLLLVMLAALEADGGMPDDGLDRILRTVLVGLIALNAQMDSEADMYGLHLKRIADFLAEADGPWAAEGKKAPDIEPLIALFRDPTRKVEGGWSGYLAGAGGSVEDVWGEISLALEA